MAKNKKIRKQLKKVIESPLKYQWIRLGDIVEEQMMELLKKLLKPLKDYNEEFRQYATLKRKYNSKKIETEPTKPEPSKDVQDINASFKFGINAAAKLMENQIKNDTTDESTSKGKVACVFVCVDDVVPHMIEHLPVLAFRCSNVLLAPLKKGADKILGEAAGLKHAACISLLEHAVTVKDSEAQISDNISIITKDLFNLLKGSVKPVSLPYLEKALKNTK